MSYIRETKRVWLPVLVILPIVLTTPACCGAVPRRAEPTETPRPTPTRMPSPTSTPLPEPTSTPTATATPQPTNTPVPADIPAPTASLLSEGDLAALRYVFSVAEIGAAFREEMERLSQLIAEAADNTQLVTDEDWHAEVISLLETVTIAEVDLRELDPPDLFADMHISVLEAADYYGEAEILLAEGLDALDPDKILQANEGMLLGTAALDDAADILQGLLWP